MQAVTVFLGAAVGREVQSRWEQLELPPCTLPCPLDAALAVQGSVAKAIPPGACPVCRLPGKPLQEQALFNAFPFLSVCCGLLWRC